MGPKISIITACYNSEQHIEHAITSVLQQSYNNIEYIIVDGASTDRTMDIVNRYRDRIDVVISERDNGIYDAFNKGVRASSGDLIYFLNSDDYLYDSTAIEKAANTYVNAGPSTAAVYGGVLKINELNGFRLLHNFQIDLGHFKKGLMPCHQGIFIKRELFFKYNLFSTNYAIASDFEFVLKVFKDHMENIVYFPEIIAVMRLGGMSSSVQNFFIMRQETIEILKQHFDESDIHYKQLSNHDLNLHYYKKWLETLLFKQRPASSLLREKGIQNVALFGSREMSLNVWKDLETSDIKVHAFLDNDVSRHGIEMNRIPIHPVEWLSENAQTIDAVILSFEGDYEEEVKRQIHQFTAPREVPCISWKEFVSMNL